MATFGNSAIHFPNLPILKIFKIKIFFKIFWKSISRLFKRCARSAGPILYGHGFGSKSLWELLSNISNKCSQKSPQILPQVVKMGSKIVQNRDKIRALKKTLKKVVFLAKKGPNTQTPRPQNPQKSGKNIL